MLSVSVLICNLYVCVCITVYHHVCSTKTLIKEQISTNKEIKVANQYQRTLQEYLGSLQNREQRKHSSDKTPKRKGLKQTISL